MRILLFTLLLWSVPEVVQNKEMSDDIDFVEVDRIRQEIRNLEQYIAFKEHLGLLESSSRYGVTSRSGSFLGKYQFGQPALQDIEFAYLVEDFLDSEFLQEQALFEYLLINQSYLEYELSEFVGTTVGGINISKAGILAAAHLGGARNIIRFLHSGGKYVFHDGNGTPITQYLEEFSQYEFELNESVYNYILSHYNPKTYEEITMPSKLPFGEMVGI